MGILDSFEAWIVGIKILELEPQKFRLQADKLISTCSNAFMSLILSLAGCSNHHCNHKSKQETS